MSRSISEYVCQVLVKVVTRRVVGPESETSAGFDLISDRGETFGRVERFVVLIKEMFG